MNKTLTCGFIGLGLIGGSIAKAFRKFYPDSRLMAYDIKQEAIKEAAREGVIDLPLSDIGREFAECNYIFLCAPVSENDKNLSRLKENLSPACLLTDVGSVKTDIHMHIKNIGLESQFIGGHPMAGSERIGYVNSKALLLENAYYILTPGEGVAKETVTSFSTLIASLGAIPMVLTCKQHDFVTAAVSHLPHVIAASLVNLIKETDSKICLKKKVLHLSQQPLVEQQTVS